MPMSFRRFVLSTVLCGTVIFSGSGFAAENGRYGAWTDPAQGASSSRQNLEGLLKSLKKLIAKAEQDRAANPMFLQDLKDLAAGYENPWNVRIFFDDFKDGNYTRSPQWSVTSGEYWVEQGYGLRNKITVSNASEKPKKVSKEQLALTILGAVLNGSRAASTKSPPAQTASKPASISTRARITNAFALTTDISSWVGAGVFEIGLTQGTSGSGYRVSYRPGVNGGQGKMELLKVTTRGQGVIDSTFLAPLEDKRTHALAWTRTTNGQMTVSVDGKSVLSVRDQSFRDSFSGLKFTSDAADVIVKSITIMGTR